MRGRLKDRTVRREPGPSPSSLSDSPLRLESKICWEGGVGLESEMCWEGGVMRPQTLAAPSCRGSTVQLQPSGVTEEEAAGLGRLAWPTLANWDCQMAG
jgi:hypothetical protein